MKDPLYPFDKALRPRCTPRWICILASILLCTIASASSDDYKLGAEDLITVTVFDHTELTQVARISKSGNVTVPLVGQLVAAGLSTRELEEELNAKFSDGGFLKHPQVTVLVTEYQSQKVSVMGQVAKPGQYYLSTANRVLDLIAQAGGVITATSFATTELAGDVATLTRKDGTQLPVVLHALFEGDPAQNFPVQGGDVIYIPRAPVFYIYGQVQKPGCYKLERRMTIRQAIASGGGLTSKGSEKRLLVTRHDASGKVIRMHPSNDALLEPDDILEIKESWF